MQLVTTYSDLVQPFCSTNATLVPSGTCIPMIVGSFSVDCLLNNGTLAGYTTVSSALSKASTQSAAGSKISTISIPTTTSAPSEDTARTTTSTLNSPESSPSFSIHSSPISNAVTSFPTSTQTQSHSSLPTPSSNSNGGGSDRVKIIVPVVIVGTILCLILGGFFIWRKSRKSPRRASSTEMICHSRGETIAQPSSGSGSDSSRSTDEFSGDGFERVPTQPSLMPPS